MGKNDIRSVRREDDGHARVSRSRCRYVAQGALRAVVRRVRAESEGRCDRPHAGGGRRGVCGEHRFKRREDRGEHARRNALGVLHPASARHREARHGPGRRVPAAEAHDDRPSASCVPRRPPLLVPGDASAADRARHPPCGADEVQLRDHRAVGHVQERRRLARTSASR